MPTERLQVKFNRTPATGMLEDVAVITMHFQSVAAGLLDNTIRAAVESAFGVFWSGYKMYVPAHTALAEYRWYDQQVWPVLSPLLRATPVTPVPGTSANGAQAPQCSMSVTLETNYRVRWGRYYLPGPTVDRLVSATGRYNTIFVDSAVDLTKTFIQAAKTAGAYPKIWSPHGGKGPPAFSSGDVTSVIGVRGDDIVDIIRSRRWQSVPYHHRVDIT